MVSGRAGRANEALTCKTELVEVVLPCDGAVRDAIYKRAEDGATTGFVDAENVWTRCGWRWGVVRVRLCDGLHVSRECQPQRVEITQRRLFVGFIS